MKIIIAGAGAVGTHLAKLLAGEDQDIILIDENQERLGKMSSNLDMMTVNYSPTSINGLKEAGVAGADLFIAVTPDESRNMTACMLAKNLGAKKTLARIDNYEYLQPKNKEFLNKLGIDSLIYPEMLAATEIVQILRRSWIREYRTFGDGALVLVDYKTDRISTPEELWERYRVQLKLYKDAVRDMTGLPVKECLLYSFWLGQPVEGPGL